MKGIKIKTSQGVYQLDFGDYLTISETSLKEVKETKREPQKEQVKTPKKKSEYAKKGWERRRIKEQELFKVGKLSYRARNKVRKALVGNSPLPEADLILVLQNLTEEEFSRKNNIGERTIKEVKNFLQKKGLSFKKKEESEDLARLNQNQYLQGSSLTE